MAFYHKIILAISEKFGKNYIVECIKPDKVEKGKVFVYIICDRKGVYLKRDVCNYFEEKYDFKSIAITNGAMYSNSADAIYGYIDSNPEGRKVYKQIEKCYENKLFYDFSIHTVGFFDEILPERILRILMSIIGIILLFCICVAVLYNIYSQDRDLSLILLESKDNLNPIIYFILEKLLNLGEFTHNLIKGI